METYLEIQRDERLMRATILIALTLLLAFPGTLFPQNVALDEGAFRIYVGEEQVGREEFSIRRAGMGDQARVILRGTVQMDLPSGGLTLSPAMEAGGTDLAASAYQIEVTGSETADISVVLAGSRYQSRVLSPQGERRREFRAGPGSVLLDDDVAHQSYLLTPFLDTGSPVSLNVLSPRAGRQSRMTLTLVGEEELRVGNRLENTRHFRLDGGEDGRDIWFDEQGRVLRVEVPSRGYRAERENLP